MTRPKPKIDPLTERLIADRQKLVERIDDTEKAIERAILESGKRLAKTPADDAFHTESAVRQLVSLKAKLEVLEAALRELDKKVAEAPGKMSAYEATLPPLVKAIEARDIVQAEVEETLRTLYDGLMRLRSLNEAAYDRLRQSARAYRAAGGARTPGLARPSFPALRFRDDLVRKFVGDLPFTEGCRLSGDASGRASNIIFNDGNEPEE